MMRIGSLTYNALTMANICFLFSLFCFGLSFVTPAAASDFFVNTAVDAADSAPGDGNCASATQLCSLRAAIMELNATAGGGRIMLNDLRYPLSIAGRSEDGSALGDLDIHVDVELVGAGQNESIIDAQHLDRVIELHSGHLRLRHIALEHGDAGTANATATAAGIFQHSASTLSLDQVRLSHMTGFGNVALALASFGKVHATQLRVIDNLNPGSFARARYGLLIEGATAEAHIREFELLNNDVLVGAAIRFSAQVEMHQGLFIAPANSVGRFVLAEMDATVLLENLTFDGHSENARMAGILNDGGAQTTVRHCTLTGLRPAIQDVHGTPRTTVSNSLFFQNLGITSACAGFLHSLGGNLFDVNPCWVQARPSDRLRPLLLGPLSQNGGFSQSRALAPIDTDLAEASQCSATDQRASARPADGNGDGLALCDSGALELHVDGLFRTSFESLPKP